MNKILSILSGIALFIGFSISSSAQSYTNGGYATLRFNTPIYSGPSINFNQVTYARSNERVYVNGCLSDYAWCDVTYRNNWRGWIDSDSLLVSNNSRSYSYYDYYSNNNAALFPIVTFFIGDYWSNHYRSYNWYRERDHYNRLDWRNQNRHWNNGYNRPHPPVVRPYPNHNNRPYPPRPNPSDRPNRPERPHSNHGGWNNNQNHGNGPNRPSENRPNRPQNDRPHPQPRPVFDKSNRPQRESREQVR